MAETGVGVEEGDEGCLVSVAAQADEGVFNLSID